MRRLGIVLAMMVAVNLLLIAGPARAATFSVNSTADATDADTADDVCDTDLATAGEQCTLRAAIEQANASSGADTIGFDIPESDPNHNPTTGVFTITPALELPPIADTVTIDGYTQPGASPNTLAVGTDARLLIEINGINAREAFGDGGENGLQIKSLRGVVVSGNTAPKGLGGGVYNEGRLRVGNSVFSANDQVGLVNRGDDMSVLNCTFSANDEYEGLITSGDQVSVVSSVFENNGDAGASNLGTLTVTDSTFSGNGVGGVRNYHDSRLKVIGTTFSNNTTYMEGGGILNYGIASVTNSTFFGNTAEIGGAIYNSYGHKLTLTSSTVSGNSGGGLYNGDPSTDSFSLRGSIVANNGAPIGPDAGGTYSSGGYNLIGDTAGASGFGATDLQGVDAGLDPLGLKDNGGPTKTIALLETSPAIDAVESGCPPPATDQRGVSRPQDGDGDMVALCDIGAYER